jgi:hypothetical protein
MVHLLAGLCDCRHVRECLSFYLAKVYVTVGGGTDLLHSTIATCLLVHLSTYWYTSALVGARDLPSLILALASLESV